MADYTTKAYEYAKAQGWTAAQVQGATYQQVATACEVETGPSPVDFFYVNIRRFVANRLQREEDSAVAETRRDIIQTKVREHAAMLNVTVEHVLENESVTGPGWFVRRAE